MEDCKKFSKVNLFIRRIGAGTNSNGGWVLWTFECCFECVWGEVSVPVLVGRDSEDAKGWNGGFTSHLLGFHHLLLTETLRHSGRLILLIVLSHFCYWDKLCYKEYAHRCVNHCMLIIISYGKHVLYLQLLAMQSTNSLYLCVSWASFCIDTRKWVYVLANKLVYCILSSWIKWLCFMPKSGAVSLHSKCLMVHSNSTVNTSHLLWLQTLNLGERKEGTRDFCFVYWVRFLLCSLSWSWTPVSDSWVLRFFYLSISWALKPQFLSIPGSQNTCLSRRGQDEFSQRQRLSFFRVGNCQQVIKSDINTSGYKTGNDFFCSD